MSPTPEQHARIGIDAALDAAGWIIQDRASMNLAAGTGVAVREFRMTSGDGFADYLLFVNGKAIGALEAKPAVYDLRTNRHFTLKTRRLTRSDLHEFVECYRPADRHNRTATWSEASPEGRWRPYTYEEIVARDKVSLDVFWLRDESLEDSPGLPEPHVLAQEIADDLRSVLAQIEDVLGDLEQRVPREGLAREPA